VALLEKVAGQGHAYAKHTLGCFHDKREEYEQAAAWYTRAPRRGRVAESDVQPRVCLDAGQGVAAADYPAVADWYTRAANAGDAASAVNLCTVGRGRAWQIMPATSSSTF